MAIEKISIEIKSNAKEIEQQLSDIDSRIKKLNSSKAEISLNAEKLATAKKSIEEINLQIRKLQAEKAELKISSDSAEEVKVRMEEIQRSINTLRATKAKLQVETQELKGADTALSKLTKEMASLSNKKAHLQVEQEEVAETETALGKLKSKLTEIGSSTTSVNLSSNISSIGGQLDSMGSKLLSLVNPLKSQLSQWIGIGAAVKAVNSAISLVTGSVSSAVSRFDQINNYPKVLQNLGVSAEDAAGSVERISESIQGLPTTLDYATKTVQGFTAAVGGNLTFAESLFDAANNAAMVFAQGSESALDSFVMQYKQALSKGRIYAQEFNIMAEAMPGLMEQIAKMMNKSTSELKEGLGEGTISVDEFNDALIKLNEEGAEGFTALSVAAKDSVGGIATGFTNMKTAVTRGVTNVISALDEMLEKANLGGFTGVLASIGNAFESGLSRVGEIITENEATITNFVNKIKSFDWASVWSGFKESITELKESARSFLDTMEPVIDFVKDRIIALGDGNFAKGLGKLPALLLKVAIGAKALGKVLKVLGKVTDFKLPSIFGSSSSEGSTGLSFNFDAGKMLNQVKNMALVFAAVKVVEEIAQALKDINDKVPADLTSLAPKLINMGIAVVGMGALVAVAGKLAGNNTKAAVSGLLAIAGISANLMLAAEAMMQIDEKVPSNIANFVEKLANMGIALVGMGALVAIAGTLASANPAAAIAGLAAVAGISLELMLAAEAMKQINDKVPDNIVEFAKKMANMGIALLGMGGIVAIVGTLMATGIGALIAGAGLVTVAAVAGELMLVAEAISQLDKKVPSNISGIKKKIDNIAKAIGYFTAADLGSVIDVFDNVVGTLDVVVVTNGINKMNDLADALKNFKVGNINASQITKKIKSIGKAMKAFTNSDLGTVADLFESFVKGLNIKMVTEAVESMNELALSLDDLTEVDSKDIGGKIESIESVFVAFTNAKLGNAITPFINFAKEVNLSQVKKSIDKLNALPETIGATEEVDVGAFKTKLARLVRAFNSFTDADFGTIITAFTTKIDELNLATVKSAIDRLNELPEAIEATKEVDVGAFIEKIARLVRVFNNFTDSDFGSVVEAFGNFAKDLNIAIVKTAIGRVNGLAEAVEALKEVDVGAFKKKLARLTRVFKAFKDADFGGALTALDNFFSEKNLESVLTSINSLNDISAKLEELQESEVDVEKVRTVVKNLSEIIGALDEDEITSDTMISADTLTEIAETIGALSSLVDSISAVGTLETEAILTTVGGVKEVLQKINELPDVINASVLESITTAITNLTTALKGMEGLFTEVGTGYGDQLVAGFESADIITKIVAVIDSLIKKLNAKKTKFTEIGKAYGDNLRRAFETAVKTMYKAIDSQVTKLKSYNTSFTTLGTNFGTSMVSAFNTAITRLSTSISSQVTAIQTSLNSLTVPSLSVDVGSSSQGTYLSKGGQVPQYLASGGLSGIFKKKGTDTVPAMLTPGEFVQNKKAVNTFGLDFMKRVNNLDIKGAFNSLAGRFSTYNMATPVMSSVVNNTDNRVNKPNVTQNITNGSQGYSMRRMNRYLQAL